MKQASAVELLSQLECYHSIQIGDARALPMQMYTSTEIYER